MNEETIKDLLNRLFAMEYHGEYGSYKLPVISKQHRKDVEQLVRQWALDNRDSRIATLEAKCFAYEQIISNSNFAPMILPDNDGGMNHVQSGG